MAHSTNSGKNPLAWPPTRERPVVSVQSSRLRGRGFVRLGSTGRLPDVPTRMWRRLVLTGAWPSVAGQTMARVCKPIEANAAGELVLAVMNEKWVREITLHESALRDGILRMTGERVSRIVARVTPEAFLQTPEGENGIGPPRRSIPSMAIPASSPDSRPRDGNETPSADSLPPTAERSLLERLEVLRDRYLSAAATRDRLRAKDS